MNKKRYLKIDAQADLQWTHAHRDLTKMNNEALYSIVVEVNK